MVGKNEINANHANCALSSILDRCLSSLEFQVRNNSCGVESGVLRARLIQRVARDCIEPYARAVKASSGMKELLSDSVVLNCGAFGLELSSGTLRIKVRALGTALRAFILHWGWVLWQILRPSSPNSDPATLLLQMAPWDVFRDGSDQQFVEFCQAGPVIPLRNARRLVVALSNPDGVETSSNITYEERPLISLLAQTKLGALDRLKLFIRHLVLGPRYFVAVLRNPLMALLATEFPYVSICEALDRRARIDAVVLTCTDVPIQSLWIRCLRNAKVHMVWYSLNWKPICWKQSPIESDPVSMKYIFADQHWVWTQSFGDYIKRFQLTQDVHVVGPLLWYLPKHMVGDKLPLRIALFDVSPYSDELAISCGEFPNYYSSGNVLSFLEDILWVAQKISSHFEQRLSVCLKTKRGYRPAYDKAYFEKLEAMVANGQIDLIPYNENLYSMLAISQLAVCYPFTSPAYVASHIGVRAIYHDPTGAVVNNAFAGEADGISFTQGREDLFRCAISILADAQK